MTIQTVSISSILGMFFTLLISIGLPVALCILVCRKMKAKVSSFFMGCITFVVFALILEQFLHALVFNLAGSVLTNNIWLYALYGGLAAAAFEETGRFIAMKCFMKKQLTRENAVMYGVGHGGIEAILIVGMLYINNLLIAVMINTGGLEASLSMLDPSLLESTLQSMSGIWTTPSYLFFTAGIERILAICLQICLSVLIFKAVSGKKCFFPIAFGIHFLVDFVAVVSSSYLSVIWVEIITLLIVSATAYFTLRVYHKD